MNLLITGSSGLIGGHVLESLSDIQGKKYCISRSGIEVESEDFIHINLDISEPNFAKDLPKDVDCIIHLAQSPFYQEFPEHVDHVFNVNLNATHELLEFGYKLKIKNFIYASSGGIYDSSDDLISEQNSFKQYSALGHYLATKLSSEIFVSQFSNFFNTQILRFFFVYGPRQHKRMLIPRLIDNVYRGNEINIFGEKGIKINPIYGEDAAHALTKSIFNET